MRGIIESAPSSKTEKIWSELVILSHSFRLFIFLFFVKHKAWLEKVP